MSDMPIDYNKLPDYLRIDKERTPAIVEIAQNHGIPKGVKEILAGKKQVNTADLELYFKKKITKDTQVTDIIPYAVLKEGLEEESRVKPKFEVDRIPPDWDIPKPDSGIGYVVEQPTENGYVVRITDSDGNKRANRYDLLDQYGNILTSAWRNDNSSRTLYESVLPGTALGLGSPRPTTDFDWESLDVILENPKKNGFKVVKK